jgi:hypothetical protein
MTSTTEQTGKTRPLMRSPLVRSPQPPSSCRMACGRGFRRRRSNCGKIGGIETDTISRTGLMPRRFFTRIVVRSNGQRTAEITCSGSLYGVSKNTGEPATVDSWYGEVHHVVYEEGAWLGEGI